MARHIYGIDFGTSRIKIYDRSKEQLLTERDVIALKPGHTVYSFGDDAYEMYEKAPDDITVTFPIRYGVIANMADMSLLFEQFFYKLNQRNKRKSGDFYIAIPTDISEVEKRAFYDLVADSKIKVKDIAVVDRPIADAVGVGIDIDSPKGNMIVNIGADTTEISVTSLGGIVVSRIMKLGGNKIDETICNIIRKKYNILIGMKTAEQVKIHLANALLPTDELEEELMTEQTYRVFGRNIITGLPANKQVSAILICEAIHEQLIALVESIKQLLERTPPELSSDIIDNGIYLTGGSSQIPGLSRLVSDATGIRVNDVESPELSVIRGMMEIIHDSKLGGLLYTPRGNDY